MPRRAKSSLGPGNRTDTLSPQPIATPTGLPYGDNKALADAQRNMPLPNAATPGPVSVPNAQVDPRVAQLQAAQAHDFKPVGLGDPSERPHEPVTAGLSVGAGPGPEALAGIPNRQGPLSSTLRDLAASTGSSALSKLADNAVGRGL